MRLLLDENLPKRLKQDLKEHEIYTAADKGWTGISNGKLLELLTENKFDALVTFDKNLQYQQNFTKYPPASARLQRVLPLSRPQIPHTKMAHYCFYLNKFSTLPKGFVCVYAPS